MELKPFQQSVLDIFDKYLDELRAQLAKADKISKANESQPDLDLKIPVPDFPKIAWDQLRERDLLPKFRRQVPYSGRKDGIGNDVPNICLKIPTGGGKTLLAAHAVSHIMGRYLQRNFGLRATSTLNTSESCWRLSPNTIEQRTGSRPGLWNWSGKRAKPLNATLC